VLGFISRRTLLAIPVVWGAMTLLFFVFFILPGDPVEQMAGERAVTPAVRANIEAKLGLDKPWYEQYGDYWARVLKGDLGESYQTNRSVNDILKDAAPASLRLAIWAMAIEVVVGIAVGLVSAIKRYSLLDALTTVSTTMMVAVPVFVLGYILQILLGVYTFQNDFPQWARFPVQGIGPNSWAFFIIPTQGQWRYLVLPAITLASVSTAVVARLMRTTMLEVNKADYMRTAAAKGLSERQVVLKHGLKNAMIPVITFIGIDLATLFGSAILTETVFNWPGLGSRIASALNAQDAPIVLGLTLVIVLAYVLVNLLVDISYAFLDPRIRVGSGAR
jgi:ABC-type dipeptide/oligopeptide/nickel transport system permease component